MFELDREIKQMADDAQENFDARIILEKEKKNLVAEREKMKDRMKKLKTRKGKHDMSQKTCKSCNKEYLDKENFNWSCRMHLGEWSGEIWWCCGKDKKDQPGCKYSQHESKDDEEINDGDEAMPKPVKNIRCLCCKETGHLTDQCPRDPNIRSMADCQDEYDRITKIKDYRKLNADTVVVTTHFLKKCVLMPTRQTEQ